MYVCYNTRVIHTTLKKTGSIHIFTKWFSCIALRYCLPFQHNPTNEIQQKNLHKATTFDTRDEVEQFSILFNLIIIFCFTYFDQPIWSMGNGYTFQTNANALRFPLMLFHSNSNAFNVIFAFFSFSFFSFSCYVFECRVKFSCCEQVFTNFMVVFKCECSLNFCI